VFPQSTVAVSIRHGQPILLKTVFTKAKLWRMCIEDPFETHDSHIIHDLGMHIDRSKQPIISRKIMEALQEITLILDRVVSDNSIDNIGVAFLSFLGRNQVTCSVYNATIMKGQPQDNRKSRRREAGRGNGATRGPDGQQVAIETTGNMQKSDGVVGDK